MNKNKNLLRKILHMFVGTLIPILIYSANYFAEVKFVMISVIFIAILMIAINLVLEHFRLKGKKFFYTDLTENIQRKEEKIILAGVYYSLSVVIISFFVYFEIISFLSYIVGLLIFGVCDGTSTIFGILFGKHKLFYNKEKSYEGSFAFFIFAIMIAFLFFRSFEKVILIALFSAFVESLPKVNDNFTLPILSTIMIEILFFY